jgi:hypothetical protein
MTPFEKKRFLVRLNEESLFNLIKDKLIPDLEKTDQFNPTDAFSVVRKKIYELKCRRADYSDLLIEKIKWDSLIQKGSVYYINSTPKGIFSFNLSKINEPEWVVGMMPKTTEFENNEKIPKVVGYLDIHKDGNDITNLLIC